MESLTVPRIWSCLQCHRTYLSRSNPAPVLPPEWLGVRRGETIEPFCSLDCLHQWLRAETRDDAA